MARSFLKSFILSILTLLLSAVHAMAQCPMCKATVESSVNAGDATAAGLNDGIFLLLGMPFIAASVVAGAWYYRYRQAQAL